MVEARNAKPVEVKSALIVPCGIFLFRAGRNAAELAEQKGNYKRNRWKGLRSTGEGLYYTGTGGFIYPADRGRGDRIAVLGLVCVCIDWFYCLMLHPTKQYAQRGGQREIAFAIAWLSCSGIRCWWRRG